MQNMYINYTAISQKMVQNDIQVFLAYSYYNCYQLLLLFYLKKIEKHNNIFKLYLKKVPFSRVAPLFLAFFPYCD